MVIIKMQQHQVDELGESIKEGLRHFGRAMSIYEDMKHSSSEDGLTERYYPRMRSDWEDYSRYPEERRGYRRY